MAETLDTIAATKVTGTETYLVTAQGKPFTAKGFGNKMRDWCDRGRLCRIARRMACANCAWCGSPISRALTSWICKAISGHKDLRELQNLHRECANRKRRAKRAIGKLEAAQIANKKPV